VSAASRHAHVATYLAAARAAYGRAGFDDADGFVPDARLAPDPNAAFLPHQFTSGGAAARRDATGFAMRAYQREATGDYLVVFAGTDGIQDWVHNTALGETQYVDSAPVLFDYLTEIARVDTEATFHFVGHSLGGALAQYAAFDLASRQVEGSPFAATAIRLTTFNAPGTLDTLKDPRDVAIPGFRADFADRVEARHYVTDGDFVPRLGGGHFAGEIHVFPNLADPARRPFGLADGHGLDRFEQILELAPTIDELLDNDLVVDRLEISTLQRAAGAIALIGNEFAGNGNETGTVESVSRLVTMAGAILALAQDAPREASGTGVPAFVAPFPEQELATLVEAIGTSLERQLDAAGAGDFEPGRLALSALSALRTVTASDSFAGRLAQDALLRSGVALSTAGLLATLLEESIVDVGLAGVFDEDLLPASMRRAVGDLVGATDAALETFVAAGGTVIGVVDALLGRPPAPVYFDAAYHRVAGGEDIGITVRLDTPAGPNGRLLVAHLSSAERLSVAGDILDVDGLADGRFLVTVPAGARAATVRLRAAPGDDTPTLVTLTVGSEPFDEVDATLEATPVNATIVRIEPPAGEGGGIGLTGTDEDDADTIPGAPHPALVGTAGPDTIRGLAGDDDLAGGDGHDDLAGGPGHDIVFGGPGNDRLVGIDRDILAGGSGHDFIEGHGLLNGGPGNDTILGADAPDVVVGGTGDDVLRTGGGDDLVGADGTVLTNSREWSVRFATAAETGGLRRIDTVGLGGTFAPDDDGGNDAVFAGPGHDLVFGGPGDDRLFGEDGLDELEGNAGDDTLVGGAGDDVLFGDTHLDVHVRGRDLIRGGSGDDLVAGGPDEDLVYGGSGDDFLFGDTDARTPETGAADRIYGEAGDDTIEAGPGSDVVDAGAGDDLVLGDHPQAGPEWQGSDQIYGGQGDDRLYGAGHGDVLVGGDGDDLLVGDIGDGVLVPALRDPFGAPVSLAPGLAGADVLIGGAGRDLLLGDAGDDSLDGGADADALEGGPGNDRLQGGAGNDALSGGPGHDLLAGGKGDDRIDPGPGHDIVRHALGRGHDVIAGASTADDFDMLMLSGIDHPADLTVETDGAAITWRFADGGGITFEAGSDAFDMVVLDGGHYVPPAALSDPARAAPLVVPDRAAPAIDAGDGDVVLDLRRTAATTVAGGAGDAWYLVGDGTDVSLADTGGIDRVLVTGTTGPGGIGGRALPDGSVAFTLGTGRVRIEHFDRTSIDAFVFPGVGLVTERALARLVARPPEASTDARPVVVPGEGPFTALLPVSFSDPNGHDTYRVEATLAGGAPLPHWLTFDGETRAVAGTAPPALAPDAVTRIPLELTAIDETGFRTLARAEVAFVPPAWIDPRTDGGTPITPGVPLAPATQWGPFTTARTLGDLDADGRAELALHRAGESIAVLPGAAASGLTPDGTATVALPWPAATRAPDAADLTGGRASADIDGDGRPDLVGVHETVDGIAVTVLFGTADAGSLAARLAELEPPADAPTGRPSAWRSPGDLDGDGRDDLTVGGLLVRGSTLAHARDGRSAQIDHDSDGEAFEAIDVRLKRAVAAGDVDGDGAGDFLFPDGLVFGRTLDPGMGILDPTLPDDPYDGVHGIAFSGAYTTVSVAGDLDGDGRLDLAFGRPETDSVRVAYGRDFAGADRLDVDLDEPGDGFSVALVIAGRGPNTVRADFGAQLAPLGDVNGDGLDDLGIGSEPYLREDGAGHAAVLFGAAARPEGVVDETDFARGAGWWLPAPGVAGLPSTTRVLPAGDVDGDGLADLLVAAERYPNDLTLYHGTATSPAARSPALRTFTGGAGADVFFGADDANALAGRAGNDFLSGGRGDDRLTGDTGDDVLVTGAGDDVVFDRAGDDTHVAGNGRDRIFDALGDDRYTVTEGEGALRILDLDGDDTLTFAGGALDPVDLAFSRVRRDLVVDVADGRSVRIKHWFGHERFRLERLALEDGRTLDATAVDALFAPAAAPEPSAFGPLDAEPFSGGPTLEVAHEIETRWMLPFG